VVRQGGEVWGERSLPQGRRRRVRRARAASFEPPETPYRSLTRWRCPTALRSCYRRGLVGLRAARRIGHMTKALAVLIVIAAFLAGCDKGPQDAGPVPTGRASHSSVTAGGEGTVSTGGSTSSGEETAGATLCNDEDMAVRIIAQEGAAGTIRTVWGVRNTSSEPCVSKGYPGMDF